MARRIDVRGDLGPVTEWTMAAVTARRAQLSGDTLFLRFIPDGRTYTYRELHRLTDGLAAALQRLGIRQKQHVAVITDNCPEQILGFYALGKLGAVSVPINPATRGELLRYYLDHADCCCAIVAAELVPFLAEVVVAMPLLRRVLVIGDAAVARQQIAPSGIEVDEFPAQLDCSQAFQSPSRYCDLAYLIYTSGTTGPSKAIIVSHACAHSWGEQSVRFRYYEPGDVDYVFLPVFHASALLVQVTGALMAGTTVALTRRFSASRFWDDVRSSGATRFNSVGAVGSFLYAQPATARDLEHKLRVCTVTPAPPFVLDFERRFGVRVINNYVLSDYGAATWRPLDAPQEKIFSCGIPRDGFSVRIVDEDDIDVPAGSQGEILLRSEQPWSTPAGYYKMPEQTIESRRNMWFHTGDRGYLDIDGYLYFIDRKKDAIRRRGENISAYEVERAILMHDAIEQVAVYPVRSEFTEDEVAASVVLKAGQSISPEALIAHCIVNMSAFMVPRFLEFVDALPLTPTSKVEKYKLKARAESAQTRLWDREQQTPSSKVTPSGGVGQRS